jgi:chemotaxis protein methyltransferase CheR
MFIDNQTIVNHSVLNFIRDTFNFDFSNYRNESIDKRFHHVLRLFSLRNLDELVILLDNQPEIFPIIRNELTISTTEMFRDVAFWKDIKNLVVPTLLQKKSISIWHGACSSGEEVYSMLILLLDAGYTGKIRLLGTDINTERLEIARKGIFKRGTFIENEEKYKNIGGKGDLSQYGEYIFPSSFKFNEVLRANVSFEFMDLLQDFPEEKFDAVFARNVLSYFELATQNNVVRKLVSSLLPNGFLCFGLRENLSWSDSFTTMSNRFSETNIFSIPSTSISASM